MLFTFDVSFVELWQHLCHAGYWLIPIIGIWFVVYARQSGPIGLATALGWCVLPFIVPDLVKLGLAWALSAVLKKHVNL